MRTRQRVPDERHGGGQVAHHQVGVYPQHPIPGLCQGSVSTGVGVDAPGVIAAVHFHDEARNWGAEVDDAVADDELPPEGDAQPAAAQASPQPSLGFGEPMPHVGGARRQELQTMRALVT